MGFTKRFCKKRKVQVWKPYSEAERIELYRRAWGPSWNPAGIGIAAGVPAKRHEAIQQHMIVVETIAGTLLRGGQNTATQRHDLLQAGYAEMIRTIDRSPVGALALDKRIARNCRTAMLRFIKDELRERRYVQQGREKAIRDACEGLGVRSRQKTLRAAHADGWAEQDESASAPPATGNGAPQGEEEFIYTDWLRGSVSVFRHARAHLFEKIQACDLPAELAEIAHEVGYQFKKVPDCDLRFYMRPTLECLKQQSPEQRRAYLETWTPLLVRDHSVARRMPPHPQRCRGLFWDGGHGLLYEAREARPATPAETVTPTARFSMVRSRTPVY